LSFIILHIPISKLLQSVLNRRLRFKTNRFLQTLGGSICSWYIPWFNRFKYLIKLNIPSQCVPKSLLQRSDTRHQFLRAIIANIEYTVCRMFRIFDRRIWYASLNAFYNAIDMV